jgi:hypothetical protein
MPRKRPDWQTAQKRGRIQKNGYDAVTTIFHVATSKDPLLEQLDAITHRKLAGRNERGAPGRTERELSQEGRVAVNYCPSCGNAFLAGALAPHFSVCRARSMVRNKVRPSPNRR